MSRAKPGASDLPSGSASLDAAAPVPSPAGAAGQGKSSLDTAAGRSKPSAPAPSPQKNGVGADQGPKDSTITQSGEPSTHGGITKQGALPAIATPIGCDAAETQAKVPSPAPTSPRGAGAGKGPVVSCYACGITARSQGDNPPPSWWVDPADTDTMLCQDCREKMRRLQEEDGDRMGVVITPENMRAERWLRAHKERLQTRPLRRLSDRSES